MTIGNLREAQIDLYAIRENVASLKASAEVENFMAVVKANGYGHGAVESARAALEGGANWLGVVDGIEASQLRKAGIQAPILTWLHSPSDDFAIQAEFNVDVGVSSIDELERAAIAKVGFVQIKVDTGLSRNGVAEQDWDLVFARAAELRSAGGPEIRAIFSHLANAGVEADSEQLIAFERAVATASAQGIEPEYLHLASTAATIGFPAARLNMVRVGLGCFGLSPFAGVGSAELGLIPAMTLRSQIVSVRKVVAGTGVSYGHRYRTSSETQLALVPLGYADGIPRCASNRASVWIDGKRFKVSGTIAMDQFVIDIGQHPVAAGDEVVIFGDPKTGYPSADDWAEASDSINYEIVARLGSRVSRTFTESRS